MEDTLEEKMRAWDLGFLENNNGDLKEDMIVITHPNQKLLFQFGKILEKFNIKTKFHFTQKSKKDNEYKLLFLTRKNVVPVLEWLYSSSKIDSYMNDENKQLMKLVYGDITEDRISYVLKRRKLAQEIIANNKEIK